MSQKSYLKARIPIAKTQSTSRPRRLIASKGDVVRLSKVEDVASKMEEKQATKPKENTLMESKADKSNFDADDTLTGKAREILADKVCLYFFAPVSPMKFIRMLYRWNNLFPSFSYFRPI